jgi:hypothetical protein
VRTSIGDGWDEKGVEEGSSRSTKGSGKSKSGTEKGVAENGSASSENVKFGKRGFAVMGKGIEFDGAVVVKDSKRDVVHCQRRDEIFSGGSWWV